MLDVSVVVPTHNRSRLVPETIASVLRQQDVSIELIVVDDGSTDGTGPWLDQLAAEDSRVSIIHHDRPRRISGARNAGIDRATARWVAFCDDDDLWAPDKLGAQLAALRAGSQRWACTGVVVFDEQFDIVGHHRVKGGPILVDLLKSNVVPTGSSVIAERSLLRDLGGFDEGLATSEDWDMWIRLAGHSPLAAVDRPLVAYRLGPQTMSMDVEAMRRSRSVIVDRYASLAAEFGARTDETMHERYLARQALRAGSRRRAASIFATLAVRHGRWRELPRMVAAAVAPTLTGQIGRARAASAVPTAWRREANVWLQPMQRQWLRNRQTAAAAS